MFRSVINNAPRLVIVLTVLSMSGCSFFGSGGDPLEVLRAEVESKVLDEERAEAMLALLDQMDALLIESAELLAEAARQERAHFVNYDSTPQDFEALFSDTSRKRRDLQEAMLDAHLEFKGKATEKEWASLLPVHVSAVSARINSLVKAAIDERG